MAAKVVALLEPVVGPGRVRVNVSARLDIQTHEETEERWDPTTVVRSRQASRNSFAFIALSTTGARRAFAPKAAGMKGVHHRPASKIRYAA